MREQSLIMSEHVNAMWKMDRIPLLTFLWTTGPKSNSLAILVQLKGMTCWGTWKGKIEVAWLNIDTFGLV